MMALSTPRMTMRQASTSVLQTSSPTLTMIPLWRSNTSIGAFIRTGRMRAFIMSIMDLKKLASAFILGMEMKMMKITTSRCLVSFTCILCDCCVLLYFPFIGNKVSILNCHLSVCISLCRWVFQVAVCIPPLLWFELYVQWLFGFVGLEG